MIDVLENRVLLSAGLLDTSFGSGGTLTIAPPAGTFVGSDAVAVQPNGRILLLEVSAQGAVGSDAPVSKVQVRRLLANGATDTSFGSGGVATIPAIVSTSHLGPNGLLVQPNGDILVSSGVTLARLTPGGALDTSFAAGKGFELTGGGPIALQSNGKIVIIGGRLNANGSRDTTYGTNGVVDLQAPPNVQFTNYSGLALDSSGRAVISVAARDSASIDAPSEFLLARLTTAGKLDTTFGVNGFASDGGQQDDLGGDDLSAVAIAPNGTIYLAANYEQGQGTDLTFLYGFSSKGVMVAKGGGLPNGGTFDLAVQSDNKLISTGYYFGSGTGSNTNVLVQRFLPAPTSVPAHVSSLQYDTTFNGTGLRQLDYTSNGLNDRESLGGYYGDYGWGVAVQPDGNIVVAGTTLEQSEQPPTFKLVVTNEFTVARLTGDASAYAAFTASDLTVSGTNGNDTINVSRNGSNILVNINGKSYGSFAVGSFPTKTPTIRVLGLAGNDTIAVHAGNIAAILYGGAGNDLLTGGEGPNTLFGGAGNDDLRPGTGPSNDIYGGDTTSSALDGLDLVDYSQRTHGMEIHLDGLRDSGMSGEHDLISPSIQRVYGSQGNDIIFGNPNGVKDALYGLGGNDVIYAGTAPNALYGGTGNDILFSRDNVADYLDGGPGIDSAHIDKLDMTVSIEHFLP
ncbi:MAG TPA: hypothetical protein VH370_07585 [Humisphaera sp.]|nr:hypothetical protein [Humisphaera sp.]